MGDTYKLSNPKEHVICASIEVEGDIVTLHVQTQFERWYRNYATFQKAQKAFDHNFHKDSAWEKIEKTS